MKKFKAHKKAGKMHLGLLAGLYSGYFILYFVFMTTLGIYGRAEMTAVSWNPFMIMTAGLNFILMNVINFRGWRILKKYDGSPESIDRCNKAAKFLTAAHAIAPMFAAFLLPISTRLGLGLGGFTVIPFVAWFCAIGCLGTSSIFFYVLWIEAFEKEISRVPQSRNRLLNSETTSSLYLKTQTRFSSDSETINHETESSMGSTKKCSESVRHLDEQVSKFRI